jgi:phosphoesterase RecJ-like protein
MQNKFISELKKLLANPKRCVIVTHRQPDGDAMGSSLAWQRVLKALKHDVVFISPTEITQNLDWLPDYNTALSFENEKLKPTAKESIQNADVIFCLDFNALSRLENLGEIIAATSAIKVMIDHHIQPENFAQLVFSNTQYAATCEMIHDVIEQLGELENIDRDTANLLYAGLCTDTGFFQFNNTTPNVMRVAGSLIAKGAEPAFISEMVNNIFSEKRLRFFGYCLDRKLQFAKNGKVAYMLLSSKEIKRFWLQNGDSEGLVNYPFKIKGVEMSVYFSEEGEKIKISFRSRGTTLDMSTFARTNFEGGGHFNASGGKSFLSLEETEQKFLKALDDLEF